MELTMWSLPVLNKPTEHHYVNVIDRQRIVQFPLTGVRELDQDHMEIIRLLDVTPKYDTIETYLQFSAVVIAYIIHNAKQEEMFMEKIHYPGTKIHKVEHSALKNVLQVVLRQTTDNEDRRSLARIHREAIEECKSILKFHILNYDKPLGSFVKYKKLTLDSFGKL